MQGKTIILFSAIALAGCHSAQTLETLTWEVGTTLPAVNGQPNIGVAGAVIGVLKDKLLVAAGANFPYAQPWEGGAKVYHKTAYLYDLAGENINIIQEFALDHAVAYTANASDETYLYTAGGEDETGAIKKVNRYELGESGVLLKTNLAELPIAVTNANLVCLDNSLFLVGGENSDVVSDKIYKLNLANPVLWEEYLTLPYPVSNAVVCADPNGKIIIAGGRKKNPLRKSTIYNQVLELDIRTKQFKSLAQLKRPLAAGTGFLYKDHLIMVGGDDASTFHQVEEYLSDISKTVDPIHKKELTSAKNLIQATHPGFSKEVWALDLNTHSWKQLDTITGESPVTTTLVLYKGQVIIPSGEVRAGVRTNQILVGQLK